MVDTHTHTGRPKFGGSTKWPPTWQTRRSHMADMYMADKVGGTKVDSKRGHKAGTWHGKVWRRGQSGLKGDKADHRIGGHGLGALPGGLHADASGHKI